MKTKTWSSWLKQNRGQKRGGKMRAGNTKEHVSMVALSSMDTCSELFGSLTPNQDNTRLSQKDSAMLSYRLQVSFMQFWITVPFPVTSSGLAESCWRVWDCNSQKHTNILIHFSWDQIFPKVINPCCMLWCITKALAMPINWSLMSAKFLLYTILLQDVSG